MNSFFKTKQNIADEYRICGRTLNRMLEENNISVRRGHIPPKDQDRIFEILGKLPVKSK